MSAPVWPGPINEGDAKTALSVQDRTKPLFGALNPDTGQITSATGVTNAMVSDGKIAPTKITDTSATLGGSGQTIVSKVVFDVDAFTSFGNERLLTLTDTTPDISGGGNVFSIDNSGYSLPPSAPNVDITDFVGGEIGQVIYVKRLDTVSRIQFDFNGSTLGPIRGRNANTANPYNLDSAFTSFIKGTDGIWREIAYLAHDGS